MKKNYFCYSSALDHEALEIWKSQHGYPDLKLDQGERVYVSGHRLAFNFVSRFWGGRVAGLVASERPEDKVYGILFEMDENLWPAIEHKEGVLTGVSVPLVVSLTSSQGPVTATAFTTNPERTSDEGPLSALFLETLQKAYRHWQFPEDVIKKQLAQV